MLKPLIWKEWHEQRWKLLFGTVMLLFFTGAFIAAKMTTSKEVVVVIWIFGGLILSLYSAMGVFASENSNRTTSFLMSKPAKAWEIFACKWFFGWLNFVVPILLCTLCLLAMNLFSKTEYRWEINKIVKGTVAIVCMATMFYTMTCCFAPRRSGEAFTGFIGLIVFLMIFLYSMALSIFLIDYSWRNQSEISFFNQIMIFVSPVSWMMWMEPSPPKINFNYNIFFIEQAVLFVVVIWAGLRKLRRSA